MENNCGNCKYWQDRNKGLNLCMLSKMPISQKDIMMLSGCGLRTTSNFSCNLHVAKQETILVDGK